MRQNLLQKLQTFFAYTSIIALVILVVVILSTAIINNVPTLAALTDWFPTPTPAPPYVAIISGHAAYDSGAVCTDASGQAILTEAEINATIAKLVVRRLQSVSWAISKPVWSGYTTSGSARAALAHS